MALEIKGKTQSLQWLSDMMAMFQRDAITIPSEYRARVLEVKKALNEDTSGMINTMLDFAVDSALVNYSVETGNENLTEALNDWLGSINRELLGIIPTGIDALAKEYFRERWKGSSNLLLRTFWEEKDGMTLPTTLYFVDGEDIKVKTDSKDGAVRLGAETYYLRINAHEKDDIKLPREKNEEIFVQRPFESWGTLKPVPYLIKKGLYRNLKFLQLLSQKGEFIVGKALEYLFVIKKGSERMAIEGRPEMTYDENDLRVLSEDLQQLIARKKNEGGSSTYTTNFDTEMEHLIPDYQKAINDIIYGPVEKRILAGLGLVNVVEGVGATRRESILNPKPFAEQVRQGIKDFRWLLKDIVLMVIEKNKKKHPKWMNTSIDINNTSVRAFMTDKFLAIIRSMYDRGRLSSRTFVELVGDMDYDIELQRRKEEKANGDEETLFPPVIQNIEGASEETNSPAEKEKDNDNEEKKKNEENPDDKESVEKKNFKNSSTSGQSYETNKDLPPAVKDLPQGAKTLLRTLFNATLENTGDENLAKEVAWSNLELKYGKVEDKWVKKSKGKQEQK